MDNCKYYVHEANKYNYDFNLNLDQGIDHIKNFIKSICSTKTSIEELTRKFVLLIKENEENMTIHLNIAAE